MHQNLDSIDYGESTELQWNICPLCCVVIGSWQSGRMEHHCWISLRMEQKRMWGLLQLLETSQHGNMQIMSPFFLRGNAFDHNVLDAIIFAQPPLPPFFQVGLTSGHYFGARWYCANHAADLSKDIS